MGPLQSQGSLTPFPGPSKRPRRASNLVDGHAIAKPLDRQLRSANSHSKTEPQNNPALNFSLRSTSLNSRCNELNCVNRTLTC